MEMILDFPDGPQVITRVLKQRSGRQKRSREEHCGEDSGRCCWLLTREEVAMNRGIQAALGGWRRQENDCPSRASRRTTTSPTLDFRPV